MTDHPTSPPAPLRIVFAGTPDFAREHLQALLDSPHQLLGVYTQPDRRAGRGKKLHPSPVKTLALDRKLAVYQPTSLRDPQAQSQLADLQADLMVVVAYGLILPQAVLDIPRLGCVNVHASLLPRWRGAAPIERAIEAGDAQTGVTIMQMDAGLDTGDMLSQVCCRIDAQTTGDSLRSTLSDIGSRALLATLDQLSSGRCEATAQDDAHSCYAPKLDRAEAWIDWSQSAETIVRKVRAFCSANVSCSELGKERVKIWMADSELSPPGESPGAILGSDKTAIRVACGEGVLRITRLQLPGRKALDAGAVINARQDMFAAGQQFQQQPAN